MSNGKESSCMSLKGSQSKCKIFIKLIYIGDAYSKMENNFQP